MKSSILLAALCLPSLASGNTDTELVDRLECTWQELRTEWHMIAAHSPAGYDWRERDIMVAQIREFHQHVRSIIAYANGMDSSGVIASVSLISLCMGAAIFMTNYLDSCSDYSRAKMSDAAFGFGIATASWIALITSAAASDLAIARLKRLVELDRSIEHFLCSISAN